MRVTIEHKKKSKTAQVDYIEIEIDECDISIVTAHSWYVQECGVHRYIRSDKGLYLHRMIMTASINQVIYHVDGDFRNNRRDNLSLRKQGMNFGKARNKTVREL